jgi:hypothetical protein
MTDHELLLRGMMALSRTSPSEAYQLAKQQVKADARRRFPWLPKFAPELDALFPQDALVALASSVPGERCFRCGKALKHSVYVDGNVYGRVCVTKVAIVDFNTPQGFYIKPRCAGSL